MRLSSCAKEDQLPAPDGQGPLAAARAHFESRGGTTDPDTSGMAYRQKKEGLLQWQDASLEVHGDTTTIFVPLHTDIQYYGVNGENGKEGLVRAFLRATKTTGRQDWQFMLVNTVPDGASVQQKGAFTGTVLLEEWFGGGTGKYMHVRTGAVQNRRELMEKLMSQVYTCYTVEVKAYVNGVLNKTHYKFVCDYVDNESFPDPLEEWGSPGNGGGSG